MVPLVGDALNFWSVGSSELQRERRLISSRLGSDILHIDAAGTSIIIVNSHQVAFDLFEKRSSIYSSRCVSLNPRSYCVLTR